MLNGNEKPKISGLPVPPAPALLIAAIWILLVVVNELIYDLPRWLDLTAIGISFVIFLYWLITGSRK